MISLTRVPAKTWIAGVVVCALIVLLRVSFWEFTALDLPLFNKGRTSKSALHDQGRFWQAFSRDLLDADPGRENAVQHAENTNLEIGYDASKDQPRPDYTTMSPQNLKWLRQEHEFFVRIIKRKEYKIPYNANTRGIVTTAGGPYLPVALVSIRMLRETGSNLPVEVFLSNWQEFDPVICGKILPSLNAKCLVLQDIFDYGTDKKLKDAGIEKYQYKIMSILFSSFEEVLFLDSDCFPIRNPEPLFHSEPFKSTGLVLWPDFWFPSESPLFFEIAGIQAPNISTRASTEAGEILYSKSKHELSLLLSAYYNFYGPNYYYPLQSQGAPGEGDKETFLWSAVALNESFYHVATRVTALGYNTKDGSWRGSAMAQYDPVQDYYNRNRNNQSDTEPTRPLPFFTHVNFPKLDPSQIFEDLSFGASGPTKDSDGIARRIWHASAEEAVEFFGFDLERTVWTVIKDIACTYEGAFTSWQGKQDICKKAEDYWNTVFGD